MTNDDKPMEVSPELFEAMAKLHCSLPLTGHEMGALSFTLDVAKETGEEILSRTDLTPEVRERTQALHDALMAIKGRVYTLITYLGIAASANLVSAQDNAATAPSTTTAQ